MTTPYSLDNDIRLASLKEENMSFKSRYNALLKRIKHVEAERDAVIQLSSPSTIEYITPRESTHTSEATAVVVASDWHLEERVEAKTVNGKNRFNLTVATERAQEFFRATIKLINKEKQSVKINDLILFLGGDFFSGNLHEELLECCELRPIEACLMARGLILSGIEYLLDNFKGKILVVCSSGNHARITKRIHIANEAGNSMEYFMYHVIANSFASEPRLKFVIEEGYHTYVKVYDQLVRFHHGHAVRYQGGVGGLTIPMNKAVAQWDKTIKADLSVNGHWHQQLDGGNFICNGSLIGYNAFALFIKAGYEPPKQLFFLIDKKRGKTTVCPIVFRI